MTRAELVALIGEPDVARLETGHWELTSRVLPYAPLDDGRPSYAEASTSLVCAVESGDPATAFAFVEIPTEILENCEDLSDERIDWTPVRYSLV